MTETTVPERKLDPEVERKIRQMNIPGVGPTMLVELVTEALGEFLLTEDEVRQIAKVETKQMLGNGRIDVLAMADLIKKAWKSLDPIFISTAQTALFQAIEEMEPLPKGW